MEFEYDLNKSSFNLKKHNIDFEDAQRLWDDSNRLEVLAKTVDEPRYIVIGLYNGRHWTAVITYRENVIRIISVRRSRKNEVDLYEG